MDEKDAQFFEPRMPEVDFPRDLEGTFAKARTSGAGEAPPAGAIQGKHVAVVTPGRMVMLHPCPPASSMPATVVESVEKILPSATKRKVAVIAFTELEVLRADLRKAIPFFGLLSGLAYIGHTVWVFEGHSSALAAGCREADLLIVDEAMIPFLPADWLRTASKVMARALIFRHERATFSLKVVKPTGEKPPVGNA